MASWTKNKPTAELAAAQETARAERRNGALWVAGLLVAIEIAWMAALIVGAVLLIRAVT